jgi:hypothetical protein
MASLFVDGWVALGLRDQGSQSQWGETQRVQVWEALGYLVGSSADMPGWGRLFDLVFPDLVWLGERPLALVLAALCGQHHQPQVQAYRARNDLMRVVLARTGVDDLFDGDGQVNEVVMASVISVVVDEYLAYGWPPDWFDHGLIHVLLTRLARAEGEELQVRHHAILRQLAGRPS